GPGQEVEHGATGPRLLLQWLPFGLVDRALSTDPHAQLLRADASLSAADERALLAAQFREQLQEELGNAGTETAVANKTAELLQQASLAGHGGLWLVPWPQGDADGALQELRIARFLPGKIIKLDQDKTVDPMTVQVPGGPDLPSVLVQHFTKVLVDGLLFIELRCWSQTTKDWTGAERVWDSARAGWLSDPKAGPVFALDRGSESLLDPSDDVFPGAIHVTLVVAIDPKAPPEGLLAEDLDADANVLQLIDPDRFPGDRAGGLVKVGPEWLHYGSFEGTQLRGLERGKRGTTAGKRPAGTGVRLGRTVEFVVPVAGAREHWNG
ncbi:MAG TPA: hypothetical protein VK348_01485, partial [Planctomycetota bacterium]|nr:hypothetical protein [Planctomycetota bacterium]